MNKDFLSAKQIGARLGCHASTVFRIAERGELPPPVKLGRLRRWKWGEIEKVIMNNRKGKK
jgi:predicted DNA-binding transcriptional regulator AlpA